MNRILLETVHSSSYSSNKTEEFDKPQIFMEPSVPVENAIGECPRQISHIEHSSHKAHSFSNESILHASQHLEEYIIGERIARSRSSVPASARALLVSKLRQWSGALSSQLLWIVGPPENILPSSVSFAALSIISTASKLDIPLLSHFCALPFYKPDGYPQPREQIALIGITYSLIRQLIQQMPPEIDTGIYLSISKLQKLNGNMDSWHESLKLLKDLLDYFPMPILLCVIDGLGRLDFKQGSKLCTQLLEILASECSAPGARFKLLLTTSGKPMGQKAALRRIPEHRRLYIPETPSSPGGGYPLDVSRQLSNNSAKRSCGG